MSADTTRGQVQIIARGSLLVRDAAKLAAARRGVSLQDFVIAAIEREIARDDEGPLRDEVAEALRAITTDTARARADMRRLLEYSVLLRTEERARMEERVNEWRRRGAGQDNPLFVLTADVGDTGTGTGTEDVGVAS